MARPLRIEMAGGLVHVMSRGNERRAIVRRHADRQPRLECLQRTVQTPIAWGRTPGVAIAAARAESGPKLHRILADVEAHLAIDY